MLDNSYQFRYIIIRMALPLGKTIQILAKEVYSHGSQVEQNSSCYVGASVDCNFSSIFS